MSTRILATSYLGVVTQSSDGGSTWQFGSIPEPAGKNISWTVTAGDGKLVAVAHEFVVGDSTPLTTNVAAWSEDGLSWTAASLPSNQYWSKPVWTGVHFVTVGHSKAAYSATGAVWTEVSLATPLPLAASPYPTRAVFFGGAVIATNYTGLDVPATTSYFITSADDGVSWSMRPETIIDGFVTGLIARSADVLVMTSLSVYAPSTHILSMPFSLVQSANFGGHSYGAANSSITATTDGGSVDIATTVVGDPLFVGATPSAAMSVVRGVVWTGSTFIYAATGNGPFPTGLVSSVDAITLVSVASAVHPSPPATWWPSYYDVIIYEPTQSGGAMTDTLNIASPFIAPADQVLGSISDALNIAHGIAGSIGLSAAITDMLVLFSDGSAAFPVDAAMVDGLYMADGGAIGTYDPYDLINNPAQYAFNIRDKAVSIYTGFDFTAYAAVGQDLYGANASGVYLLRGATDDGAPVAAGLDLGATTLGTTKAKSIEAVYLGLDTDGCAYVRTYVNGAERTYRVVRNGQIMRALLAKGVTGRTWGVKVDITEASHASLDVVELFTGINTRRWTR